MKRLFVILVLIWGCDGTAGPSNCNFSVLVHGELYHPTWVYTEIGDTIKIVSGKMTLSFSPIATLGVVYLGEHEYISHVEARVLKDRVSGRFSFEGGDGVFDLPSGVSIQGEMSTEDIEDRFY